MQNTLKMYDLQIKIKQDNQQPRSCLDCNRRVNTYQKM